MNILLATDGSEAAKSAEALLARIKCLRDSEVVVAAVSPPVAYFGPMLVPSADLAMSALGANLTEIGLSHAEKNAKQAADRLIASGIRTRTVHSEGPIVATLIKIAQDNGCSLIVAGSRGENALKGFLLGSVARSLVNHSPISVLIAKPLLNADAPVNAVVAVDDSDGATDALKAVKVWGPDNFAAICAVCATPLSQLPPALEPELYAELINADVESARKIVHNAAQTLSGTAKEVGTHIETGRPADVIIETAKRTAADIIAIGAARHGTLERLILGSVAYEVATTAPCSTLVVRPNAA